MPDFTDDPVVSRTQQANPTFSGGVYGESTLFNGVRGVTYAQGHGAVVGVSENHTTQAGPGVFGQSDGTGVWGESKTWMGVYGHSDSATGGAGVMGEGDQAPGVIGKSAKWIGVYGETAGTDNGPAGVWGEHKGAGAGVKAVSKDGVGLEAYSVNHEAIHAEARSPVMAAIAAYNLNPSGTGAAIFAKKDGTQGHAGYFDGNVHVTGALSVQGVNVTALTDQLQARIAYLETLLQVYLPPLASISVQQIGPVSNGTALFLITGSGFRPGALVNVHTKTNNPVYADSDGKMSFQKQVPCVRGETVSFTAVDPNHPKGPQYSNTVMHPCS
jgi:hypothetical protein